MLYLRPIRSSGSTEGELEEAGRAEHRIICENHLVGSELPSKRTHQHKHTTTCRISVGEAFRSKAAKGILFLGLTRTPGRDNTGMIP